MARKVAREKMQTSATGIHSKGFTLLELMVVLAIMALALAVVPMQMEGTLERARLQAAARQLTQGLRLTQSSAMAQRQPQRLVVDTRHGLWRTAQRSHHLPRGITVMLTTARSERVNAFMSAVRFYPDGTATGGAIELRNKSGAVSIQVDWLTGAVAVRRKPT